MPIPPKYMLARSYVLSAALDALITDAGGTLRTASILPVGRFVRPRLARAAAAGTSTEDPHELFSTTAAAISAGAGGGTWTITQGADGRVVVGWSGPGTATIFAGAITRALGFVGGITCTAGGSQTAAYPPLGALLWAFCEQDTDWRAELTRAASQDEAGRVYVRGSTLVRWRRSLRVFWAGRAWTDNASGEYMSPAWWDDVAFAGSTTATALDPHTLVAAQPEAWLESLASISGQVAWGFTDDLQSLGEDDPVSTVYIEPETLEALQIAQTERAPNLRTRRSIALSLSRVGTLEVPA